VNKRLHTNGNRICSPVLAAGLLLAGLLAAPAALAQACPPLQDLYPDPADPAQWPLTLERLNPLLALCLESTEYFALLGAAQLNTGNIPAALEALERALLLDPANGAAQVDYAEALYASGQLFPALEINTALLQRSDLPPTLAAMLAQRQQSWQTQTRSRGLQAGLALGYDNNLNGAPANSSFTLTLSGEQVVLTLDPEFQPADGPFLNLRLNGFYQRSTPDRSHDLVFALRGRASEESASDQLQFDWRYALVLPLRRYQWDLVAGTSHLMFGGSPLYSVTEARARLRGRREGCLPQYEVATQHQLYHGQSFMTGLEASLSAGFECTLAEGRQRIAVEAGPLSNIALNKQRPGDNRNGWRLGLNWHWQVGRGLLTSQFSYSRLADENGYSGLLADGAKRQVHSRFLRLQYSRSLQPKLALQFNFTHQNQGSNIAPFDNRGSAADIGLNYIF